MGDASRIRQPRWTDARLVAGVLMVLVSVVGGAAVVGNADRSVEVWAVRRALPAGATLQRDDLTQRRVRLFGEDRRRYLDARGGDPAGRVLTRPLGDGELLPVTALSDGTRATRVVGLPLTRAHALGGEVERGDIVDVLATRKTTGGGVETYAVARAVPVVGVDRPASGFGAGRGGEFVVLVEVAPDLALDLAAALRGAEIDLSLVVPGADGTGDVGGPVTAAAP